MERGFDLVFAGFHRAGKVAPMKRPRDFIKPVTLTRVRELRQQPTEGEERFWAHVRDRRFAGLKFRRQHRLLRFIADFYCPERKLVVEIDGTIHEGQQEYDAVRD